MIELLTPNKTTALVAEDRKEEYLKLGYKEVKPKSPKKKASN